MKLKTTIVGMLYLCTLFGTVHASDIEARGASFPKAVYTDWMEAYEEATGIKINYTPTGSGDGIISAVKRKSDFSGTDKPLRPWRLERYKLTMFPAIVGSIVLAYNIPGVADNDLKLDEEAISAIFSGGAKFWDDPRIVKENMHLELPHEPIKVVVRSDGSGTTYNFTYYLRKIDYAHFKKAEKDFDWKADTIEAEGSSGMSQQIKSTEYSIGYTDFSYKQKYDLSVATLKNRVGKWVSPSLKTSTNGAKYANLSKKNDFYGIIAYPKGKTSYPIIATSFVLLPYENENKNKKITEFFDWAFLNGEAIANKHGFAMLPKETLKEIGLYWKEKVL
ncbi:phosphate ABC transporter substrate-binding protein PstS [Sulfurovum sp.]|uniref:phosphate ABC transporter substrate-binding protein PstS n=1 Tax=Sulfurovum sp. TaxID=1969726 RepID=UPI002867D9C7|nr:phosphate ABC transporter substrate-binding protein PstS [Sulfurovum sp.]